MPVVAKLFDGDIIIETRDAFSKALRMRFRSKQQNRKWERRSLGTEDIELAKEKSKSIYSKYHAQIDAGIPTEFERTFADLCEAYKKRLILMTESGIDKPIHSTYVSIINKWLIPILGKKPLSQIDESAIDELDFERKLLYKGEPPKSTINQHNVVLRAVLEFAASKKYIKRHDIPRFSIKDKGKPAKRRPRFSPDEVVRLLKYMEGWELLGKTSATNFKRQLLRCYVEFLYYTGCRPGREIGELRWRNIERTETKLRVRFEHSKNDKHHRWITADSRLHTSLERLKILTHPVAPDMYLFRMFGGKQVTGFSEMFSNALTEAGLRLNQHNEPRTLYSLRHSFASEKILSKKIGREVLCRHLGTSWQMLELYYIELNDLLDEEEFSVGDIDIFDAEKATAELEAHILGGSK